MSLLPAPSEWSPLEEQFHTWDIVLLNPPATGIPGPPTRVLGQWASISVTESHEGIRTSVEINAEEPAIPFIHELVTDFLFYRDRVLLYRLRVVDSEDALTRDAATVKFDCVSYDKLLERRILHEDWILDDYDINAAWRLIDYTQRKQTFGITRGTTTPGVRRQRGLDAGDDILSSINDFAQADGGFDWWIDQNLVFWAAKPRRGKTLDTLWQLGGEVGEMTRVNPIEDYASLIMSTGAQSEVRIPRPDGQEDVYQPPDPQIVELPVKPFGLWEYTTSDTDVITAASLREKALWHLADKGGVRPTYKMTLEPGVWSPNVAIGDVFTLRVASVRVAVRVPVRIEELQITCTADGAETVSLSVRAEEPETPETPIGGTPLPQLTAGSGAPAPNGRTVQRHYLDPADDLGALLRSMRKRLDRAERSPGIGGPSGGGILDGRYRPTFYDGSPGDYYVDTTADQLYGPKNDGDLYPPAPETWPSTGAPNTLYADSEVGFQFRGYAEGQIVGVRYGGMADASDLTLTFWDMATGAKLWQTTGPGTGGEFVIDPPLPLYTDQTSYYHATSWYAVSLGGAQVPVCDPRPRTNLDPSGGSFYVPQPAAPPYLSIYWVGQKGPVGIAPTSAGDFVPDIQLVVTTQSGLQIRDAETHIPITHPFPDSNNVGQEVGVGIFASRPCNLLGWRYRRLADSTSPMTWTVWNRLDGATATSYGAAIVTVVTTDSDYGEFEVRLPEPISLDPFIPQGYSNVMITTGGDAIAYLSNPTPPDGGPFNHVYAYGPSFPFDSFYTYDYYLEYNAVIGKMPDHHASGYKLFEISPIMEEIKEVWPLSNAARSDNPARQRAELKRNLDDPRVPTWWADDGLHFYEGGPSHPNKSYSPLPRADGTVGESNVPWWDVIFHYDGNSGVELLPNDWFRRYGSAPDGTPYLTGNYAYYAWYWDYAYQEQDSDLDRRDPNYPGSYFMLYNDQSTWDYYSYQGLACYGPYYGARVDDRCDDFERAALGPGWVDGPKFDEGSYTTVLENSISDGALVAGENDHPAPDAVWGSVRSTAPFAGTQSIEAQVGNFFQGHDPSLDWWFQWVEGEVWLLTQVVGGSSNACFGVYIIIQVDSYTSHGQVYMQLVTVAADGTRTYLADGFIDGPPPGWESNPTYTVRLETTAAGHCKAFFNGMLLVEDDLPPTGGQYVGVAQKWNRTNYASTVPNLGTSPRFEEVCFGLPYEGVSNGGAGFHCEVSEVNDGTGVTAVAQMHSIADDGIWGTQLSCTPRVIQACFQPQGYNSTWWAGDYPSEALTPKGCVSPLVTAASATATAADEPWQKQFFRQIGTNTVTFSAGVGQIPVPTGMAQPCVVNAQVDGVAVGGSRVVQARRTGDYVITVALDTAYSGDLSINWMVEHAVLTFGTPPPSIDFITNLYGPWYSGGDVDYDVAGGDWPTEVTSIGRTFVTGCVLKDFTGAVVGGPFTVLDNTDPAIPDYVFSNYVNWTVGRDWYLPGENQQFQMTNPDGQVSNWFVLHWVDAIAFAARQAKVAANPQRFTPAGWETTTAGRAASTQEEGEGGIIPGGSPTQYANDPKLHPRVNPLLLARRTGDETVEPRPKKKGGKERREARRERARQERARRHPPEEPPTETTEQ